MAIPQKKKYARYAEELPNKGVKQPVKIESRPAGTPKERNVDITNLSKTEREAVSLKHGLEGQAIRARIVAQQLAEAEAAAVPGPTTEQTALAGQVGKPQELTPEQLKAEKDQITIPANLKEAAPGIIAEALQKGAIGAGTGAAAGLIGGVAAPVTVPAAAAIGGGIGVATGLIGGILKGLKDESKEDVDVEYAGFIENKKSIKAIIAGLNKGAIDEQDAVDLYNREIGKMQREERRLKMLTDGDLKEFLSDGRIKQTKVYTFLYGGQKEASDLAMQKAILNPNPNAIFTFEEDISELGTEL